MSFGWNCMFRRGSWLEFRRFVLLQRQNVGERINYINKELQNIGEVRVLYETVGEGQDQKMTEKRIGLEVSMNSSLGKLMTAYVAQGGNPFDISMFLKPDSYKWVERENEEVPDNGQGLAVQDEQGNPVDKYRKETQPYGGIVSPKTAGEGESEMIDTAGWLPLWKYGARRLGGKNKSIYPRADQIGGVISNARKWVTQEIATLRNDIEARILKLCDLREQLMRERDDILVNAISGTALDLPPFDPKNQLEELHLSHIVTNIDLNFFEAKDLEGNTEPQGEDTSELNPVDKKSTRVPNFDAPRERGSEPYYKCLLDDVETGEEDNTAL